MKIQSSTGGYIQPSMDNSSQIKKAAENSELSFLDFIISYISNPTFTGEFNADTTNNNQLKDFSSTEMEIKSPEFEQLAQKILGLIGETNSPDQIKSLFGKTDVNFTSEISENIESIIKTFYLTEDLGIEHSTIKEVIAEKLKLFSPEEIKLISIKSPQKESNIVIESAKISQTIAELIKLSENYKNTNNSVKQIISITAEQKPTLTNLEKDVQISAKTKAEIPVSEKPIVDKPIINNKSAELENGKEFKVETKPENKITAEQKPTLTNLEKLNHYAINPEMEQNTKNELKQNKNIQTIVNSNVENIIQRSKPNQPETLLTKDNDFSNSSYFKTSGVVESNKSENYNFAQNKSNNSETYLPNQKEVDEKLEVELNKEQIYTKPSGYMDEIKTFNNQVKPTKFATFTNVKFEDIPQYVEKMTKVLKNGETYKATMQLKPENLGSIFVNLSMKDDVLNIVIKANTTQTIDKLDSSTYQLKDALISQGFKSENIILRIENNSSLEQNYTTQYSDERNGKQENNKEWKEFLNIIRNYSKNEDKKQQQEVVV